MTKLLADNTHYIEIFPHFSKSEQNAILQLRSLVPQLLTSEKTALAILMTDSYARSSGRVSWVNVRADRGFGSDLTNIVFLISKLSPASKRLIAIELLLQAPTEDEDEDEGDGLPDPSDYEGEEYYSSDRPALGGDEHGDHYYQPSFSVPS